MHRLKVGGTNLWYFLVGTREVVLETDRSPIGSRPLTLLQYHHRDNAKVYHGMRGVESTQGMVVRGSWGTTGEREEGTCPAVRRPVIRLICLMVVVVIIPNSGTAHLYCKVYCTVPN